MRKKRLYVVGLLICFSLLIGCVGGDATKPVSLVLTLQVQGEGDVTPFVGTRTYAANTTIEIEALPRAGFQFSHWIGEVQTNQARTFVLLDKSKTVTAVFIPEEEPDLVLYDTVRELPSQEEDNILDFSLEKGDLVFRERTPYVESIGIGDIILADPYLGVLEHGLLQKVTGISPDGLTFYTEAATLEDVIEDGVLSGHTSITFLEFVQGLVLAEGVTVLSINIIDQTVEFERELEAGDKIFGHIGLRSSLSLEHELRYRVRLEHLRFEIHVDLDLDINYQSEDTLSSEFKEHYPLATFYAPRIPLFTGVWITPRLEFRVGAETKIEAGLKKGVSWVPSISAGLEYKRGQGFSPIGSVDFQDFTVKPLSLVGKAEATAYAGVDLSGLIWGSGGFGVGVFAYGHGEGEVRISLEKEEWTFEYDLAIGCKIASAAELKIARIADLSWDGPELDLWRVPLAYGVSGRAVEMVEGKKVGVKDVTLDFEGTKVGGFPIPAALTDEHGHFTQDLLANSVTIIPEKEGYLFTPRSLVVDKKTSDASFVGEDLLLGTWVGATTYTEAQLPEIQALPVSALEEGCEFFEDMDEMMEAFGELLAILLEALMGYPIPTEMEFLPVEEGTDFFASTEDPQYLVLVRLGPVYVADLDLDIDWRDYEGCELEDNSLLMNPEDEIPLLGLLKKNRLTLSLPEGVDAAQMLFTGMITIPKTNAPPFVQGQFRTEEEDNFLGGTFRVVKEL